MRAFFLLGSDDVDDDDYDDPLLILGMAKMSKWSGYLKAKIIADGIRGGGRYVASSAAWCLLACFWRLLHFEISDDKA